MGICDGKAAVVTGGGRGIGRGHCLHLGEQGASVVVNDLDPEVAQEVVDEIKAAGGTAVANSSDISERKGAAELVQQCVDEFGKIDAIVNNAGIARDKTMLKMSDEDFDLVMKIHLYGTFYCGQEAARRMKDQGTGGAIVNTVSGAAFGNFGQTNYSAAKGAIASMTLTWAVELGRYGIRVNAIAVGSIETDALAPFLAEGDLRAKMEALTPMGRVGTVEDIALAAVYLASDAAAYVNGVTLTIDGGSVTVSTTYMSPGWLPGIPLPFRRSLLAWLEFGGIRRSTGPEGVGDFTVAPRAASQGATGKSRYTSGPSTRYRSWGLSST